MSTLARRRETVFKANANDSTLPNFAVGYTVTAFEVGAVVNGSGQNEVSAITVHAGHGIEELDWIIVGLDITTFRTVLSVDATTINIAGVLTVADNDVIVNLGVDTGTDNTPDYDKSGVTIYLDPNSESAISESRVTTSATGTYGYWYSAGEIWELIRDGDGAPVAIVMDISGAGVTGPGTSTANAVPRYSGTTGAVLLDSGVTIDNSDNVDIPGTLTVDLASTLTGAVTMAAAATVGTTLGVTGALTASAAATIGTTLGVTGASTLTGDVDSQGVFKASTVTTLGAADTTPDVNAGNLFITGGAITITDFDLGQVGQTITILAAFATTIEHNASIIILDGGVDFVMAAGDVLHLTMFNDTVWNEVGRVVIA